MLLTIPPAGENSVNDNMSFVSLQYIYVWSICHTGHNQISRCTDDNQQQVLNVCLGTFVYMQF